MLRGQLSLTLGLVWGLCGCHAPPPSTASTPPGEHDAHPGSAEPSHGGARLGRPDTAGTIEYPMRRLETQHIVLPVTLPGGGHVDFILDTGASLSVVTPGTRDAFGFAKEDGMEVAGQGAGGALHGVRLLVLDEIVIGGHPYGQHRVAVMDLEHLEDKLGSPIGGILGQNFLKEHLIELDFEQGKIRLHEPHLDLADRPELEEIAFETFERSGLIRLAVALNDMPGMPAVLDIGAGRTVINWNAAREAGLTATSQGLIPSHEPLLGADNKPVKSAIFRFSSLRLGELVFPRPEVFVADLPVFSTLGIADGPAMVFGIDMFEDRRLFLDYTGERIFVSRPTAR